jgi:hypothetical protein
MSIEIIKPSGGSGGITSLNGLTASTQFLVVGTSGTDFAISSSVNTNTFNLPTASAINRGALSSADWTTFNNKQATLVSGTNIKTINSTSILGSGNLVVAATPSGISGAVQFSDGSAFASDATNFFWDDTNNRLGIGTNAPTARLSVKGAGSSAATTNTQWVNSAGGIIGALNDAGNVSFIGKGSFGNAGSGSILNVKGSGATSATSPVLVQNSSSSQTFSVRDDGVVFVGLTGLAVGSAKFQVKDQSDNICISVSQSDILFGNSAVLRSNDGIMYPTGNITFRNGNPNSAVINFGDSEVNSVSATGVFSFIKFTRNWTSVAPSLNLAINVQETQNVINMTNGTGTKIFRGYYHNPTTTAVTSHRAFESTSGGGHFNTTSVDASSVLQADSTTQGFLMPRMTEAQILAIVSPANGLQAYNTTQAVPCFYDGIAWRKISHTTM